MSKWDLVMQNTFLFPVLCLFFSLSVIPSSQHLNKEQSRFRENIKDPALRTKPLLGTPVSQNSLSTTHWRLIFCLTMTSVIKRSPIYLQVVLKITNETFASVFGVRLQRLLILVKMRQRAKDETKRKKKECHLLNLVSDRLLLKAFPLPRKVPLEVVVSLPTVRIDSFL